MRDQRRHALVPRATIVDVARQADIPMATVPDVLNHTKRVSKDGRSRVQQAVGRLNYWPSHLPVGCGASEQPRWAPAACRYRHQSGQSAAQGLGGRPGRTGRRGAIGDSEGSELQDGAEVRRLLQRQIDGLIFQPAGTDRAAQGRISALVPCVAVEPCP